MFFPPLVSSFTSGRDDMEVMLPGIWIMALAPLPLLGWQSLGAVGLWVALITVGEVIWSPRSSSYAASMCVKGARGPSPRGWSRVPAEVTGHSYHPLLYCALCWTAYCIVLYCTVLYLIEPY